jgi:predicted Rossmann fold nucleotide-binding protein DprA/Smf involved in DNA uptake
MGNHVPVIVCAAREIGAYRAPPFWCEAIDSGMLLLLSSSASSRRITKQSSLARNELVAALADEVVVLHAEAGSNTERLARELELRGKVVRRP